MTSDQEADMLESLRGRFPDGFFDLLEKNVEAAALSVAMNLSPCAAATLMWCMMKTPKLAPKCTEFLQHLAVAEEVVAGAHEAVGIVASAIAAEKRRRTSEQMRDN